MSRQIVLQSLSYKGLIDEIRNRALVDLPTWDFDNQNDIGRYIVDLLAALIERHNVYANSLANEAFIDTAIDVRRLTLLSHQYGYLPQTPQPERVKIQLTFNIPPSVPPITIQKYSIRLKAAETPFSVFYENNEDISLPPGGSAPTTYVTVVEFIEGITRNVTFISTGLDFQIYTINDIGIVLDKLDSNYGIKVQVGNDVYSYTPTFLWSLPGQRPFRLLPHLDGKLNIQFSDNFLGEKPMQGESITVTYRVGGGIYNYSPNRIRLIDTVPNGVILAGVKQMSNTYGGSFGDTTKTIKFNAYSMNDFSVRFEKEEQIENYGRSIPGVGRLKVTALGTLLLITIIPTGLGIPSTQLTDDVKNAIIPRVPMGYDFSFVSPTYKEVGLKITLRTNEDPFLYGFIENQVINIVNRYLHPLTLKEDGTFLQDFGGTLKISTLLQTIKDEVTNVFDYDVQWMLRGSVGFSSTDLNLNLGEIVTSQRQVPVFTQTSGPNSIQVQANIVSSLNKFLFINIVPGSGSDLSSALTTTPTSIIYTLTLSSNASKNSYLNVSKFINQDPNAILVPGTYAGIPHYRNTPIFLASYTGSPNTVVMPTGGSVQLSYPSDLVNLDVIITT